MLLKPHMSYNMTNSGVYMPPLIDLTGLKFGKLIVEKRCEKNSRNRPAWVCKCRCGNQCVVNGEELKKSETKSCGCYRKDLLRIELTNKRFGKLKVLSQAEKRGKSTAQFWNCICDCGEKIKASSQHLRTNAVSSCGCLQDEELELKKYSEDFLSQIDKSQTCWLWKGSLSRGYGRFLAGKVISAHRFSFLLHKGLIPDKKIICHTCDNPKCVNPDHLYAGSYIDNARDRDERTNKRKMLDVR